MMSTKLLFTQRLVSLALAFVFLGLGQTSAQDAALFQRVEDNDASTMLQETLVNVSAGVVLELSPAVLENLRDKNLESWKMELPCPPEFQAEHNHATWHLEVDSVLCASRNL